MHKKASYMTYHHLRKPAIWHKQIHGITSSKKDLYGISSQKGRNIADHLLKKPDAWHIISENQPHDISSYLAYHHLREPATGLIISKSSYKTYDLLRQPAICYFIISERQLHGISYSPKVSYNIRGISSSETASYMAYHCLKNGSNLLYHLKTAALVHCIWSSENGSYVSYHL